MRDVCIPLLLYRCKRRGDHCTRALQIYNQVVYKDSVFRSIFGRDPDVFETRTENSLLATSDSITVDNVFTHVSESEILFGMVNRITGWDLARLGLELLGLSVMAAGVILPISTMYVLEASNVAMAKVWLGVSILQAGLQLSFTISAGLNGELQLSDVANCAVSIAMVVISAVALNRAIQFNETQKALLTSCNDGANISVKTGTKTQQVSAGLGSDLNEGLGTYADQGGHHTMAKKAFEGVAGYDPDSAITISNAQLKKFGVKHATITGQQHILYSDFSKSGKPFTMEAMREIEIQALVNSKIPSEYATHWVDAAIDDLLKHGIVQPKNIPWG